MIALVFALLLQAGPARVVDGDTLDLAGERVRLYGIDAPESGQTCERAGQVWACGTAAAEALGAWLHGRQVTCVELERDRFGRSVATCQADGEDVGGWMVRQGWAVEFTRYSDGRYAEAEASARERLVGMHAGAFDDPADWRAGRRATATQAPGMW
jgi:endonuclease YncB( thermonuclease family)